MKTHDIARILTSLAQTLRNLPNVPLEDFEPSPRSNKHVASSEIPAALTTLVALSDFDKSQWQALIREYDLPIEIRPRDASRDVLGKLLKHLEQNPDARRKITTVAQKIRSDTSPELMRALQFLLNDK